MSDCGTRHTSDDSYDTLATRVVPIVVVPGVMGSRIDIDGGMSWDPDSTLAMSDWLTCSMEQTLDNLWVDESPQAAVLRKLASRKSLLGDDAAGALRDTYRAEVGLAPGEPVDDDALLAHYEARGWGGVAWDFYGPMLVWLEREFNAYVEVEGMLVQRDDALRCPVYAFGYDWRQSNATSGAALRAFVESGPLRDYTGEGVQQVILLTHSMGGLVARWACVGEGGEGFLEKVRGVIHCALPSNGAIAFYRRCFTGCVSEYHDNGDAGVINFLMGHTWWRWLAAVSGAPGPIQLLPAHTYQDGQPPAAPQWIQVPTAGGIASVGYDITKRSAQLVDPGTIYHEYVNNEWYGVFPPFSPEALDDSPLETGHSWVRTRRLLRGALHQAEQFHIALDANGGWHPCTFVLFSVGIVTDEWMRVDQVASARIRLTDTFAIEWHQSRSGDGSVPRLSAACRAGDQTRIKGRLAFSRGDNLDHGSVLKSETYRDRIFLYVRTIVIEDPAALPDACGEPRTVDDPYFDCEAGA